MKFEDIDISKTFFDGRLSFVVENGKTVMFYDLSNLQGQAYLDFLAQHYDWYKGIEFKPKSVYIYTDVRNTKVNDSIIEEMKKLLVMSRQSTRKFAIVGMEGIQKIIAKTLIAFSMMDIKFFDTKEAAMKWLTE